MANGTITAPKGFKVAGVACGIKVSGKPDVGLIVCPEGATASGVFTTNQIYAAPVKISRSHLGGHPIKGVVVNAGNANACTGPKGEKNAITMCRELAKLLKADPHEILVASTGIIGEPLPMVNVRQGIKAAYRELGTTAQAGKRFARSILTTDTKIKQAVRTLDISGETVTIAGTIKGAGMIAPNMATTLCFLTTDVAMDQPCVQQVLRDAIDQTVNRLTVDGHQSTNDTAFLLASGQAENRPIVRACSRYRQFKEALTDLCDDLTRQMAMDAEGATRMFKVVVTGAANPTDAEIVARAIADYPLVKCAVHGGDPNWGRIICAIGSSSVGLKPERVTCSLDGLTVFASGVPKRFNAQRAADVVSQDCHTITVDLGMGRSRAHCYGVDLSRGYVRINADYHT